MWDKMKKFHEHKLQKPPKQRSTEPGEGQLRILPETPSANGINLRNGETNVISNSNRRLLEGQPNNPGASQAAPPIDPRAPRLVASQDGGSSQPGTAAARIPVRSSGNGSAASAVTGAAGASASRLNGSQANRSLPRPDGGTSEDSNSSPEAAAGPVMPKVPSAKAKSSKADADYKIRKKNEQPHSYLDKREPLDSDKEQSDLPSGKLAGDRLDPALTKTNLQSVLKTVLRATPVSEEGKKPFDFPYLEMYSRAVETLPKSLAALPPAQDTKWLKV